jgi:NAD(P)-dependent dehydrogenase (short-subunit alcohol dehydrogenase family)
MSGKVALVTGAAAGIGRATALAFAKEGAKVVVADLATAGGEETANLIRSDGGDAVFVQTNVAIEGEVASMINATIATYGRLDYAFNNAGIEGAITPTADYPIEMWDRVLAINLTGVWFCMRAEIPEMLKQGGAIVNCSSVAGLVGFKGLAAYVASKHALVGLTKVAALDYAQSGIRINAVCPGVIDTSMIERVTGGDPNAEEGFIALEPVGRMGTPEEVAAAVVWMCSCSSSFVTGHALVVDGGFVAQ